MNSLLHWLTSPEWTHVVGALLHSLWQGAIIAIALAILMRRLANPVTRYRCALVTLGLVVMAGIVTWAVLNAPKSALPIASAIPVSERAIAPVATATLNPDSADKIVALGRMSPPPAPKYWIAWLAVVWMLGAVAMLLRAGIKVAGAENLRRSCQPLNDERMVALVADARRAVGLVRQIRVAVTDKLTSPAVVGVIVPTLILPLSLFTALTPEQIRFILLHELAHIRRGDYFANLFQLLAEALLFFNPAVWWISHQIRREREACCDALAIELSGAPADYARTLVRVAENILQPATNAALAFGDGQREPSSLADRVQRLLVPGYRPALRLTWRAMLASLVVGGALLVLSAVGTRSTVGAILSPREKTASEPLISSPVTNFGNNSTTTPVPATFTGIMTDPQFRAVVKAINQRSGINSPNEDQVTQLSDRRAQVLISAVEKNNVAAEIENQPGRIGAAKTTTDSITNQATNTNSTNSIQRQPSEPTVPLTNGIQQTQSLSQAARKGRDVISQKLDQIKFDKVIYRGLSLFEVVRILNDEARMRDPDQKGINFIIDPNVPGGTNQISLTNCPTFNMDKEVIGVTLREALDVIVRVSSAKIHYSIEDYAVIFGLGDPIEPLQSRTFKIDLKVISAALGVPMPAETANDSPTASNPPNETRTIESPSLLAALRERFRSASVDVDRPGVVIFLNGRERQGKLLVYATKKDLDTIESLLAVINTPPPQVNIKVKWVEFTQNDTRTLGFDWFLGNVLLGNHGGAAASPGTALSYQGIPVAAHPLGQFLGVLTDSQYRAIDKTIFERGGADLLSQGSVTTLSGRQCQIQNTEMETIVTGINPQALSPPGVNSTTNVLETQTTPFGQTLDVVPTVSPNEAKISLRIIATHTEFLGYAKTNSDVPIYINGTQQKGSSPFPRYHNQKLTNDCTVSDGQTLMLGKLSTIEVSKQLNGEFLTKDITGSKTNFLFVFVTPTIVDPAGNRVNKGGK